jgi:hypothetical protein
LTLCSGVASSSSGEESEEMYFFSPKDFFREQVKAGENKKG